MIHPDNLAAREEIAGVGTAPIGEVAPDVVAILDHAIAPLPPSRAAAGRAFTVQCQPGDNLTSHHALAAVCPGDVLVVGFGQSLETGPFDEIMARCSQTRGAAAGMVIDGAVRDSAQIAAMGFPVWARGFAIPGTIRVGAGQMGAGCTIGDVPIGAGDIIVGDADATIAFPPTALGSILNEGCMRPTDETMMRQRIKAGETTLPILGLNT